MCGLGQPLAALMLRVQTWLRLADPAGGRVCEGFASHRGASHRFGDRTSCALGVWRQPDIVDVAAGHRRAAVWRDGGRAPRSPLAGTPAPVAACFVAAVGRCRTGQAACRGRAVCGDRGGVGGAMAAGGGRLVQAQKCGRVALGDGFDFRYAEARGAQAGEDLFEAVRVERVVLLLEVA